MVCSISCGNTEFLFSVNINGKGFRQITKNKNLWHPAISPDNKTLIAVIFWIIAVLGNRKNPKYRYIIIASVVLFLIYIIPHSVLGSELDYESGKVVTGFIQLLF